MEVVDSVRVDAVHDTGIIAGKWVSDVGRIGVFLFSDAKLKVSLESVVDERQAFVVAALPMSPSPI